MIGAIQHSAPLGALLCQKVARAMDVILHIGAHRTGTTSFQQYLDRNGAALRDHRIAHWGPKRTRGGLFAGLMIKPVNVGAQAARRAHRSSGLIKTNISDLRRTGQGHLIISDENTIGSIRHNLAQSALYPDLLPRLLRLRAGLATNLTRIVLTVRSYSSYWSSALAYSARAGGRVATPDMLDRLVTQPRRWRSIVHDVRLAFPSAEIVVCPFEQFAGRSDALLRAALGGQVMGGDFAADDRWHNPSPSADQLRAILADRGQDPSAIAGGSGRWVPFDDPQRAAMADQYASDIDWLRGGADGIAHYIETPFDHIRTEHIRPTRDEVTGRCLPDGAAGAGGQIYGKQRYLV